MNPASQNKYHLAACISLTALILLCILWETLIAPLRPGGSWMALKALPLLLPLRGVLKRDNYTMQWSSMLIWLYFTEGVVRAGSDTLAASAMLAWMETGLALIFFFSTILYLRPYKKAARALAKSKKHG